MSDLISRQAVLDKAYELDLIDTGNDIRVWVVDVDEVKKLPAADLSEYSDKLWKTAYERGKAEAHPKKGKWKEVQVVIGRDGDFITKEYECEICGYQQYHHENFCGRCGARMEN